MLLSSEAAICEIAGHRQFVLALTVDLESAVGDRERFRVPTLMPTQQANAAQDVSLERGIVDARG